MTRRVARLLTMSPAEAAFRGVTFARQAVDRGEAMLGHTWDRASLRRRLAPTSSLTPVRRALEAHRWEDAHRMLVDALLARRATFVIHPRDREAIVKTVLDVAPDAPGRARTLADASRAGRLSLLGYENLSFGTPPDWHLDPVHDRRSPRVFWADVPYLDPAIGDHKTIWEVNRHQHWLHLGRAYWLTDDETYGAAFERELESWLRANPPLVGINWASMLELGFRCLSWTWAAHFFASAPRSNGPWMVDLLLGLDRQLSHIAHNLSYYFSPNTHLIGEGLALFVCGYAFPELAASGSRVAQGRSTLLKSLARQVEPDGGHCERSTHYHRYALDFALLALAVARRVDDPAIDQLTNVAGRLGDAARLLSDDGGHLPHIGDDDGGMLLPMTGRGPDAVDDSLYVASALTGRPELAVAATAPEEAVWLLGSEAPELVRAPDASATDEAARPRPRSRALTVTGYYVSRSPQGAHMVVDGGPHGFLNGGHAHADALSLTLAVDGRPFLVDTGTGSYTSDPAVRDRFRDTAAHNTVVIDGRSQSVPDGPFHWRTMTDARTSRWVTDTHFDYFEGTHGGYSPVLHRRSIFVLHDDLIVVADTIAPASPAGAQSDRHATHSAATHWHVHPAWRLERQGRLVTATSDHRTVQLALPTGCLECFEGDPHSRLGWYSPVYGRIEPLTTIRQSAQGSIPFALCGVIGLDPANPIVAIHQTSCGRGVTNRDGVGLRVVRQHSVDDVAFAPSDTRTGLLWRWSHYESDARLLFCRRTHPGIVVSLLAVDASQAQILAEEPDRASLETAPLTSGVA